MQRVLQCAHLTTQPPKRRHHASRPHPDATSPNAIHATDILTRWMTGGEGVQTCTTVDISSNDADATSPAATTSAAACEHVLPTWPQLGVPDVAPCDNASACSGGPHPGALGTVVRLCLSMGIDAWCIPLGAADDHSPVATCNPLWAQRCWGRHHCTRRRDVSRVQRTLLAWYHSPYIAPRPPDTPERMRLGTRVSTLASHDVTDLPHRLPPCTGRVHAVRRVAPEGWGSLLNPSFRVGKRSRARDVWLTRETAPQRLRMWYQGRPKTPWQRRKTVEVPLRASVVAVPKRCARLHAARQRSARSCPP